ncbi:MAG: type II toxin-antitoxin system VapC family toxin [Pseudomonadales bacterium]|nr:type II toxin-antitoxin system VapC family toxin [Pseudomonadales bacterium]
MSNALLLDTHVFLWFVGDDDALSEKVRHYIRDFDGLVYVSSISLWEIQVKHEIGKLELNTSFEEITDVVAQSGFEHLSFSASHVVGLSSLPQLHKDPFDRALVSQALYEECVLFTADKKILQYECEIIDVRSF